MSEMKAFKKICETATKGPLFKRDHDLRVHTEKRNPHYWLIATLAVGCDENGLKDGQEDSANAALLALGRNYIERLVESLRSQRCSWCEYDLDGPGNPKRRCVHCANDRALLAEIEEAAKEKV